MSILSNQINVFCNSLVRRSMRRRWNDLGGEPVSILSNNCLAGLIYHDIGLRFDSPTINLWMPIASFITFMEHVDEAIHSEIDQVSDMSIPYPVGRITLSRGEHIIPINFMHYKTFDEAVAAWRKRAGRVNRSRLVVIAAENVCCTENELLRFKSLPFSKLLLTANPKTKAFLGSDAFLIRGLRQNHFNVTDFCGFFGRRFYHQMDPVSTTFRLLRKSLPLPKQ